MNLTNKELGTIVLLAMLFAALIGVTLHAESVRNDWNSLDIGAARLHHNAIRACELNLTRKENCRAEVVILEPGQEAVIVDAQGNRANCVHVSLGEHPHGSARQEGIASGFASSVPRNPCALESSQP